MKVKCYIKEYAQERNFQGQNGERIARDLRLVQVNDNPLVEDKYPNEFIASCFTHLDDASLARAMANKIASVYDLSFYVTENTDRTRQFQHIKIQGINNE